MVRELGCGLQTSPASDSNASRKCVPRALVVTVGHSYEMGTLGYSSVAVVHGGTVAG